MNTAIRGNTAEAVALRDDGLPERICAVRRQEHKTYGEMSDCQLESLAFALGREPETPRYVDLQRFLFQPWRDYGVPERPEYPSMIADDHSPYEYSLAYSPSGVELRILFEAQAAQPSLEGNQVAAELVNERLRARFNVDLSKFETVRDLFLPAHPRPPFSLWHAVSLSAGKEPEFKVYLNPAAHGPENAHAVVREAMTRLGFGRSIARLLEKVGQRGPLDEIRYFSLDLAPGHHARAKVYFAHLNVSTRELEEAFSHAPTHRSGDVESFCDAMVQKRGPFTRKPVTSCFSFVAGSDKPSAATLHVPVAHYLSDDHLAARRIIGFLDANGLPGALHASALGALSPRPLNTGPGLQSYASYRRERAGLRCTVYVSSELFTSHDECSHTRMTLAGL